LQPTSLPAAARQAQRWLAWLFLLIALPYPDQVASAMIDREIDADVLTITEQRSVTVHVEHPGVYLLHEQDAPMSCPLCEPVDHDHGDGTHTERADGPMQRLGIVPDAAHDLPVPAGTTARITAERLVATSLLPTSPPPER